MHPQDVRSKLHDKHTVMTDDGSFIVCLCGRVPFVPFCRHTHIDTLH